MAIVINLFDENVESGDSYTPDLTGSDNGLIYIGTGIEVTSGADGSFNGAATQSSTSFTTDSTHNGSVGFGTRTFTDASGQILDTSIPTGANTFTQAITNTFDDTTYSVFDISGMDQTTPFKESTQITYNNADPGAMTYSIDDGGLVVLIVLTNINTPQTPSGWTAQGSNKALDIISDYVVYTRIATADEVNTTVTPTMDSNGNGRGMARLWVYNPSVAGGTDVTATLETLTLTDFNSTVEALVSLEVSATLETLSLTDLNTTVEALVNLNIAATLDTLTLTDFNSTVEINTDVNVTATLETLSLTDFNSTVEALVDTNVTTTLETLTLTDFNSIVSTSSNVEISVTLETLTLTDFNTTVEALVNLEVTSTLEALSLTDFNTTVFLGSGVNILSTLEALTLTDLNTSIESTDRPIHLQGKGTMMYSQLADYYVLNPQCNSNIVEVCTEEDLKDLAVGEVITVSEDMFLIMKNSVDSNIRFVITDGANLNMSSQDGVASYTYRGDGTLVSGVGSFRTGGRLQLISTSGNATLVDASGGTLNFTNNSLVGWSSLGSYSNGNVFIRFTGIVNWLEGFTFSNIQVLTILSAGSIVGPTNASLITYNNSTKEDAIAEFIGVPGRLAPTTSVLRISPSILDSTRVAISDSTVSTGMLFDTSGLDGAFTAVTDSSIISTSITSVTDSSGNARFNYTGSTVYVGQLLDVASFTTNTSYNVSRLVTVTASGYFELEDVTFGSDEATGTFSGNSVTMTELSTALMEGDDVDIEISDSNDYDGGTVVYNVLTNSFQINRAFVIDDSGTWSTRGLDQTNPKVLATSNSNFTNSMYMACGFVNANSTEVGSITSNVFRDIVLGTSGSALISCSNTERWKLIDDVTGEWEYIGNEPFNGTINYDVTATSSGGTRDFRFKWVVDTGSGYTDLPDNIETLVEIGSTASSTSKAIPLAISKGTKVKPQVTRNDGSSTVTITYYTNNITQ